MHSVFLSCSFVFLIVITTLSKDVESQSSCPDKRWHRFRNKCFFAESHTFHTFEANKRNCAAGGGTLASVHSAAENKFLETVVLRNNCSYWIGVDHFTPGKMDYRWMDKTPFNYTNWNPGEPNNYQGSCSRTYINKGKWEDAPCRWTRCALCQITLGEDADEDFPANFTGKSVSVEDFQRVVAELRRLFEQIRETRISQELLEDVNDKLVIQATYWETLNDTFDTSMSQMKQELRNLSDEMVALHNKYTRIVIAEEQKSVTMPSMQEGASSTNKYGAVFFIFIVVGILLLGFAYMKLNPRAVRSDSYSYRRESLFEGSASHI